MKQLKIITSNIRFANPSDGVHDWPMRLPLLSKFYQEMAPDILGTQEGRIDQLKELDELLPGLQLIDNHRQWIPERMYPCLFINPQTISVERSGDVWLSATPHIPGSLSFDSAFPRLCTWAEVTLIKDNLKLMIVNTHLDHILSSTRIKQTAVLIEEVKKINDRPVLIMGDFNESPLTDIQADLRTAFKLKDPWVESLLSEESSHHGFLGSGSPAGDRIDWILIPENFGCVKIALDKRTNENGIYPSDHYPLVATVIPN